MTDKTSISTPNYKRICSNYSIKSQTNLNHKYFSFAKQLELYTKIAKNYVPTPKHKTKDTGDRCMHTKRDTRMIWLMCVPMTHYMTKTETMCSNTAVVWWHDVLGRVSEIEKCRWCYQKIGTLFHNLGPQIVASLSSAKSKFPSLFHVLSQVGLVLQQVFT